jgi:hypothetical protein
LLGETPAQLSTAVVQTPAGQRLAFTIRTPSTTVTVFLAGKDAKAWASNMSQVAGSMSANGLMVAGGKITPPP